MSAHEWATSDAKHVLPMERVITSLSSLRNYGFIVLCGLMLVLGACQDKETPHAKHTPRPVLVTTEPVMVKNAPYFLEGIGTVRAFRSVDIKPRITGKLTKLDYSVGKPVSENQLLFSIDPEPFIAKLHQAEARLASAKAELRHAETDFRRYEDLLSQKMVSPEKYEEVRVRTDSKKSAVEQREADLKLARLDLKYCSIRSPVDGHLGVIHIDEGNVVNAYRDTIANVVQTKPIRVDFSLPSKFLNKIRTRASEANLEVQAFIKGDSKPEIGHLAAIDNAISSQTGMIKLEGLFDNEKERLWPGQFVRALLKIDETPDAVLAPAIAVKEGPHGAYVWAVKKDKTVEMRPVKVARRIGDMSVISSGLGKGDVVVTKGGLTLYPGAKIVAESDVEKTADRGAAGAPSTSGKK